MFYTPVKSRWPALVLGLLLAVGFNVGAAQVTVDENAAEDVLEQDSEVGSTESSVTADRGVDPQAVPAIQIDADQLTGYGNLIDRINGHPQIRDAGLKITSDPKKWLIQLNGQPAPAGQSLDGIEVESIQYISVSPDAGPSPDGGVVSIKTEQASPD